MDKTRLFALVVLLCWLQISTARKKRCSEWQSFVTKYNKTYDSPSEMKYRKKVFFKNVRKINEHNMRYHRQNLLFNCSINRFTDLTTEEFVANFTGLKEKPRFQSLLHIDDLLDLSGIKDVIGNTKKDEVTVDWRNTAVTSVSRQGNCGSCWAFALAGALEGQFYMKTKRLVKLSPQNLIDCIKTEDTFGCSGGTMSTAYKWVESEGIMRESDYPYEEADDLDCNYNRKKKVTSCSGYVEITPGSEHELEYAVRLKGPIACGIHASHLSLQFYKSGIYFEPKCQPEAINHAVLCVGFGREDGTDYWIIKNSWGKAWGEHGYFRLTRNQENHCGVATFATYPIV